MTFETLGNPENPAVMLIHGMLCTSADCMPFGKYLAEKYYVIMPTLDGHGSDGTDLLNVQEESAKMVFFLKQHGISELKLLQGSSMGGEVALAVNYALMQNQIPVGCCFLDGAPCFDFNPMFREFMYHVFRKMTGIFDTDNPEQAYQAMIQNPFLKFVLKDKAEQYRPLIESMAKERRTFSEKTIRNMVQICYHCELPDFPEQIQKNIIIFFSKEEPARKSRPRLMKAYPKAKFRDMNGYGHCGFQTVHPRAYAEMLRRAAEHLL